MTFLTPQRCVISTYTLFNSVRLLTLSALLMALIGQFLVLISNLKTRADDLNAIGGPNVSRDGSLYAGTDLSTLVGAVAGFAVSHALSVIIIFLGLLAELPTPTSFDRKVQSFWSRVFPSFGESHGKGVLGLLILLIGSFELAQSNQGFPRIAAWFLFICGIFNLLLGITLGSDIHSYRSISHLRSLSPPSSDLESNSNLSVVAPQLPQTTSFSESIQETSRSPFPAALHLNLNRLRFTIPSFRRNSVQSDSIYSQDVPHSHFHHQFQQHLHQQSHSNNLGGGGDISTDGYMSEGGDRSPLSMQQAFSARDFEQTGPMNQIGRSRNHY